MVTAMDLIRISLLLIVAVLLSGCPRPVGGCQYGSAGGERWTGEVMRMEALDDASGTIHVILVEGESTEEFRLREEDYQACIAPHGIEEGSEVVVELQYGGPCPPMRRILECPFGG